MSNYADKSFDRFWHWGKDEDFVDLGQEMHWVATVKFLESGLDPETFDPNKSEGHPRAAAIVEFPVEAGRQAGPSRPAPHHRALDGWRAFRA